MGNFLQSLTESKALNAMNSLCINNRNTIIDKKKKHHSIEKAQLQTRLHHLVHGYLRHQLYSYDTYHHFEQSLINVMIAFLGNILFAFDIYPSKCKSMFTQYGTVFTRNNKDKDKKLFTFGCLHGINEE